MFSARLIARSAPRAAARLTATTTLRSSIARPSTFTKTSTLTSLKSCSPRAFSTTLGRRAADGETDDELSAKLESEIQVEEEMAAQEPSSVRDYLDNSPFELIDTPGKEVVKLQRQFGDEQITVSFSIADISEYDPYANEDPALEDEDLALDDVQNPNKQSHVPGSGGARSAPAEEDLEDQDLDDPVDDVPPAISLSILIEKPGKTAGALHVDATATDGNVVVENMFYYEDAAVARAETPEAIQKRSDVYPGPPFGSLDEDLQVLLESFLEERGITQAMGVFVPDYVDVKEQREYSRWLANVKDFVDA